jgi:hypothetical protein
MDSATARTTRSTWEEWANSQREHDLARVGLEPAHPVENAKVIENKKTAKPPETIKTPDLATQQLRSAYGCGGQI